MIDRKTCSLLLLFLAGCATQTGLPEDVHGPSLTTIRADEAITALEFSRDRRYLVQLLASGSVEFHDVFQGGKKFDWSAEDFAATSLAVGTHDRFAVASGRRVRVCRIGERRGTDFSATSDVLFLRFDESSQQLAIATDDGRISVHDATTGAPIRHYDHGADEKLIRVEPTPGFGGIFLFASGKVRIVSCEDRGGDVTLNYPRKPDTQVSISADHRLLAFRNLEGQIEIRQVAVVENEPIPHELPWPVDSFQLAPDGSVLIASSREKGVMLWDTVKREPLDQNPDPSHGSGIEGLVASRAGNLLAWIEANRIARIWSPVKDVIQWPQGEPVLRPEARTVCRNLAETIRFGRATESFSRGVRLLDSREFQAALDAFEVTWKVMSNYPGLSVARSQATERQEAERVGAKLATLESVGQYRDALTLLDGFLREHGKFGDYGFKVRADVLRQTIQHLDSADEHRQAGRDVDAVIEFEAAAKIVPELEGRNVEYVELRTRLLARLATEAKSAYEAKDYIKVIRATNSLARLRSLEGEAQMRLAVSHELLGNTTTAEKVYLEVPKGTQQYVPARRSIARIARAAHDYTKARTHLELAREDVIVDPSLETEYAEICQLCKDYDAAVAAWRRVGNLEPKNPRPFASIATIEEIRERWPAAATALATAIERSPQPRPKLMVRMAEVLRKGGGREKVVAIYEEILTFVAERPEQVAFLGETPRIEVENRIRDLSYVNRSDEWIPREQFLEEQGWEHHDGRWLRPREARLRAVAERYHKVSDDELRAFSDERYRSYADENRITKGMSRREVIRAWGFFGELTVLSSGEKDVVFEQLNFEHSRKVYLRNGLVCYWSE